MDKTGKKPEVAITTEMKVLDMLRKAEKETVTETYDATIFDRYDFWTKTVEDDVGQEEIFDWFNVLKHNVARSASVKTLWSVAVFLGVAAVVLNFTIL